MLAEISHSSKNVNCTISLSGSKSISNRVLIIKAISGLTFTPDNISESEDTKLLQKALSGIDSGNSFDVNHAGTSFRFLTALLAVREGEFHITGSERLKERPVGELVSVLRQLGADIHFLEKDGFPPLKITGKKIYGGDVVIRGDISSQFITALLLIAPTFEKGLKLKISTPLVSRPYVEMTIQLMREFSIIIDYSDSEIIVHSGNYSFSEKSYVIEGDWSSAGYWFEIAALADSAKIVVENIFQKSTQADSAIPQIFEQFGVVTGFEGSSVTILKNGSADIVPQFNYDFTDCPDSAQTVAATCAALGINAYLTGLQTLKIKETDRIAALKNELGEPGLAVSADESSVRLEGKLSSSEKNVKTYHDHRMALSFSPLALKADKVLIDDAHVIGKSYPAYWNDLEKAGFTVRFS